MVSQSPDTVVPLSAICNFWKGATVFRSLLRISFTRTSTGYRSETSVKTCLLAEFDLHSRRNWLDSTALQVAQYQEDTVEKRRELAAGTKNFKRNASEDVLKAVGTLLKQYQEEIDRITKRYVVFASYVNLYK